MFLDKEHRGGPIEFSDEVTSVAESTDTMHVDANDNDLLLSASEKEDMKGLASISNGSSAYHAPLTSSDQSLSNSLVITGVSQQSSSSAIDDLLGLGFPSIPVARAPLALIAKPVLSPADFQLKWRQLPITSTQVLMALIYVYAPAVCTFNIFVHVYICNFDIYRYVY